MSPEPEEIESEPIEPVGQVRVVYLGPVAPHWEVQSEFGDPAMIDAFRERALARLVLLPPHDPQFRRNRERVVRDAERENLTLDWDLGFPERGRGRLTTGGPLVGQVDPFQPQAGGVDLRRRGQGSGRRPQPGQRLLAGRSTTPRRTPRPGRPARARGRGRTAPRRPAPP